MSSSWNAEESCIELTMRVEELNYTIYGCTNALRALNGRVGQHPYGCFPP